MACEVATNISAKTLRIDSLIVKLAEGVNVGLTGGTIGELAAEKVGRSVSIFAAIYLVALIVTEITFEEAS